MASNTFSQVQSTSQTQNIILYQKQIYMLNILSFNTKDLQKEIAKIASENPLLEIKKQSFQYDNTHTSHVSKSQEDLSDAYTKAYQETASTKETLQEHLLSQLNMMHLLDDEYNLGKALIQNLDKNGYHIFAPASLLDSSRPLQTQKMLKKMLNLIQNFEPEGTCCSNMEESLYIQAKQKKDAPPLALFILNGNIDVLYSTKSQVNLEEIQKKLIQLKNEKSLLVFAKENNELNFDLTTKDIQDAISFISKLNPHPAANYSSSLTQYVSADIKLEKLQGAIPEQKEEDTLFINIDNASYFKISLTEESFPNIAVNKSFKEKPNRAIKKQITQVEQLIKAIEYRKEFTLQCCEQIINTQKDFFLSNGNKFLEPLLQTELAKLFSVHKSTVSRMANEKYIQSPWGQLYPLKFFFASKKSKIKNLLAQIIQDSSHLNEQLSDTQLVKELAKQGIKISRRSITQYRNELDIAPSYKRNSTKRNIQ